MGQSLVRQIRFKPRYFEGPAFFIEMHEPITHSAEKVQTPEQAKHALEHAFGVVLSNREGLRQRIREAGYVLLANPSHQRSGMATQLGYGIGINEGDRQREVAYLHTTEERHGEVMWRIVVDDDHAEKIASLVLGNETKPTCTRK